MKDDKPICYYRDSLMRFAKSPAANDDSDNDDDPSQGPYKWY